MPLTQIVCLGLSYRTAPVDVRERLSCSLTDRGHLLPPLQDQPGSESNAATIRELVVLSTCNRIELYAYVSESVIAPRDLLIQYLEDVYDIEPAVFAQQFYDYSGIEAARHLFEVSAGLDSLVLGESQILGQVSDAYMAALEARTAGPVLSTLFRAAVRAGKRVRSETKISNNPASISSVAITLAQQVVGDLNQRRTLVIGLGEMGQLALKALRSRNITPIAVANRTRERAEAAVAAWGGQVYSLAELPQALASADVVISATAAPNTILDMATVQAALAGRDGRKLVLIDLAVPRDIDAAVGNLPGVYLFGIDQLRSSLDEALGARQQEIPLVEAIIDQETAAFAAELRELAIRPLIVDLRHKAERIRQRELQRTLRHLGDIDPQMLQHIQHLSHSLVNKLLHEPTIRLKEKAGDGAVAETADYAETIRHLFGLETTPDSL